jgi:hypothetical protein
MEPPDFLDITGPDPTGGLREMRNLSITMHTAIPAAALSKRIPGKKHA